MGAGQSTPDVPEIPANIQAPPLAVVDSVIQGDVGALTSTAGGGANPDVLNTSVLERIAQAANDLKGNEHAQNLINLMHEQERSWQQKFETDTAQANVEVEVQRQRLEQVKGEEQRQTMDYQNRARQQQAENEDQLARRRYEEQLQMQHQAAERERQSQMQAVQAQEQEKRRTQEYQAMLDRETNKMKSETDGIANAQQERANRDIRDEQVVLRAEQDRITTLESIKEWGRVVGDGVSDYLSDQYKIAATVGVVTSLAAGVYLTRAGSNAAGKYLAARLTQPPLIRETSRKNAALSPISFITSSFARASEDGVLGGMVLEPNIQRQLRDITISTARARQHNASYRNVMLYGPPGTGKTMFAMRLAKQSGLDYAVLAGGDVAPLGPGAITELHRVFDWGESRKNGLVLFIDEADAFLRKRGDDRDGEMSETMRNTLSTFLYRTGTRSDKIMLVLATNEPALFDRAIIDRVDELVELGLPGVEERAALLEKYYSEAILDPVRRIRVADEAVISSEDGSWLKLAEKLDGMSGRQIMKLCQGWQAAAYASNDNVLTQELMARTMLQIQEQQDKKLEWDTR